MKKDKETIKSYFQTGDKPKQEEYYDTWDSFWHKDEVIPFQNQETPSLQQVTEEGSSTTNDIELVGGNLTITDGDTPSNPYNGNLNISYTDEDNGNVFSIYNAITKVKSSANEYLYGVNNLMYHNAPEDINQVYGSYNMARSMGSGSPNDLVGMYNGASHRNTGSGTINVVSGSENYVKIDDYGGTGDINYAIGARGKIVHSNPNLTTHNAYNGVFEMDLEAGNVSRWTGVWIGLNKTDGTISSGQFLRLDSEGQLPNANMKAINSTVDLPSYFKGSLESDITITDIDTANNKVLPTKEWVQANSTSKFSSNVGDGSSTTINVSHNLGSEDVMVQVRNTSTKTIIDCTITVIDTNSISLTFDTAPSIDEYRAVVIG